MLEKKLQQLLDELKTGYLKVKYNIREVNIEEPDILLQKPTEIEFSKEDRISDFFVDFHFLLKDKRVIVNNYYQDPLKKGLSNAEFLLKNNIKIENVYAIIKFFSNPISYNEVYYTIYKNFSSVSFKQQLSYFLAQRKDIIELALNKVMFAKDDKELLVLYEDFKKRIAE